MENSEEFDPKLFKENVIKELRTEERFVNYFKAFRPDTIDSFIESYASEKTLWHQYGEMYLSENEKEQTRWIDAAHVHLEAILQKKLFDTQCLWRAEKIKLKDILHTYDFDCWERNIFNCPFLEPISEADIQLYVQFLLQIDEGTEMSWRPDWQNYDAIKEAYHSEEDEEIIPAWYHFHMNHTGSGSLLMLPDLKGEKEEYYMDAWRESTREETQRLIREMEDKMDKRPVLSHYSPEFYDMFLPKFESRQTIEYYKAYKEFNNRTDHDILQMEIYSMLEQSELIPVEAHYDWREALSIAFAKFKAKKAIEFLPMAWDQYKMNLSLGISFSSEHGLPEDDETRQEYISYIIKGRIFKGEEPNLDY